MTAKTPREITASVRKRKLNDGGLYDMRGLGVTDDQASLASMFEETILAGRFDEMTAQSKTELVGVLELAMKTYAREHDASAVKKPGYIVFWGSTNLDVEYRCAYCRQIAAEYTASDVARRSTHTTQNMINAGQMLEGFPESPSGLDEMIRQISVAPDIAVSAANQLMRIERELLDERFPKIYEHTRLCALRYLAGKIIPTNPAQTAHLRHARSKQR